MAINDNVGRLRARWVTVPSASGGSRLEMVWESVPTRAVPAPARPSETLSTTPALARVPA